MRERVCHANLKNMLSPTINSEQKGRRKSFHENQILGRSKLLSQVFFLQIRPKNLIEGL